MALVARVWTIPKEWRRESFRSGLASALIELKEKNPAPEEAGSCRTFEGLPATSNFPADVLSPQDMTVQTRSLTSPAPFGRRILPGSRVRAESPVGLAVPAVVPDLEVVPTAKRDHITLHQFQVRSLVKADDMVQVDVLQSPARGAGGVLSQHAGTE